MNYCIIGAISYLLFLIYDVNEIKKIHRVLKLTFVLGIILQISATIGIFYSNLSNLIISGFGIVISLFGLVFLIYSLFFALPFEENYIKVEEIRKVYNRGVYAMSRHPGVLFYIIFFIGLTILEPTIIAISTYFIWSLLNITYIIFQEMWTFPRTFVDYETYRQSTPFLIPTIKSINSSIKNI
ncbi:MAG: methyltransferase [Firmicutes bacterium]|nr:methyltransferase [Bacillota bacterium]